MQYPRNKCWVYTQLNQFINKALVWNLSGAFEKSMKGGIRLNALFSVPSNVVS